MDEKARVSAVVNGERVEFDIVKMTVREPQTGALLDMTMNPTPKVPFVYGYTEHEIRNAVFTELRDHPEGGGLPCMARTAVASAVVKRLQWYRTGK